MSTIDCIHKLSGASVALSCRLSALGEGAGESAARARWLLEQANSSGWRDPRASAMALLGCCTALADAAQVAIETADQAHTLAAKKSAVGKADAVGRSSFGAGAPPVAPSGGAASPRRQKTAKKAA